MRSSSRLAFLGPLAGKAAVAAVPLACTMGLKVVKVRTLAGATTPHPPPQAVCHPLIAVIG